ncbi:MAG: hypothetical protein Q9170_004054 [Blastenia crenularia]
MFFVWKFQPSKRIAGDKEKHVSFERAIPHGPVDPQFPIRHFYNGNLIRHESAIKDNETRQLVRQVSLEYYGIKGETEAKDGSECFMIDVVNTAARVEAGGNSLVNHGNVDAIALLVRRLLAAGIPGSSIVILCMYKAQLKLLLTVVSVCQEDGSITYREMSTVDAFQGREARVIIYCTTVGKVYMDYNVKDLAEDDKADDKADDEGVESNLATQSIYGGHAFGRLTAFARDYHRQCVADTRAQDGYIIVGQRAFLLQSMRKGKDTLFNTLAHMVRDLGKRNLIYTDREHIDTHPEAIKDRAAMPQDVSHAQAQQTTEVQRLAFINRLTVFGHQNAMMKASGKGSAGLFGTQAEEPLLAPTRPPLRLQEVEEVINLEEGEEEQVELEEEEEEEGLAEEEVSPEVLIKVLELQSDH